MAALCLEFFPDIHVPLLAGRREPELLAAIRRFQLPSDLT